MNETHIQLLNKYLDGTCTPQELAQVNILLEDFGGADDMLHQLMQEREEQYDAQISDPDLADKVAEMETTVFNRIEAKEVKDGRDTNGRFSIRALGFTRIAAVWAGIILLSSVAVWQFLSNTPSQDIMYSTYDNDHAYPLRYTLPDSTTVYLGSGGQLRYPQSFAGDSRNVILSGDAFFEVTPDSQRPFTVQTGSMTTRVLGTSFKIDAHQGYPMIVSVATGKVSVSSNKNEQLEELAKLTPGLKLTYNQANGEFEQGVVNIEAMKHWISGDLVFDEQSLGLVMQTIEKRYGLSVTFANKEVAHYRVSGSFEKEQDIQNIMKMLSIIGKFQYKFNDNQSLTLFK